MVDLEDLKFTPEEDTPAETVAPQFRPDFRDLSPAPPERETEPARAEFRMPLTPEQLPEEWKPLGAWKFWGYTLLFSLPLLGFVCAFVCAMAATNLNVRGLARSYFCWLLVAVLVIAVAVGVAFALQIDPASIIPTEYFNL